VSHSGSAIRPAIPAGLRKKETTPYWISCRHRTKGRLISSVASVAILNRKNNCNKNICFSVFSKRRKPFYNLENAEVDTSMPGTDG